MLLKKLLYHVILIISNRFLLYFYIVIRKIMHLFFLVKYPGAAVFAELIY